MIDQIKNMLVGIFIVAACSVIVWLILFLKPTAGNKKETLFVRFSNINQLNVGTQVTYAGKPVGEVTAIQEISNARNKPSSDILGEIYVFQLTLKVDSSVKVFDTDEITIQTSGLLGEKSIAIIPKIPPKGVTPILITNQPIFAQSVDVFQQAFKEISDLAADMQSAFQDVSCWFKNYGDDMGKTVRTMDQTLSEIQKVAKSLNETSVVDEMKVAVQNASNTFNEINQTFKQLKVDDFFANASDTMKTIKSASTNLNIITQDIADGKGSLGKLTKDDDFYLRMTGVMSKLNTTMNDINHYGLMFNLNKSWQRQRAQRVTALNALNSPDKFKRYFQDEVDEINTSMARISMLIDKAEQLPEKERISQNEQFRKDFAELLRLSDEMSDNLKLYNQQLVEAVK